LIESRRLDGGKCGKIPMTEEKLSRFT